MGEDEQVKVLRLGQIQTVPPGSNPESLGLGLLALDLVPLVMLGEGRVEHGLVVGEVALDILVLDLEAVVVVDAVGDHDGVSGADGAH